jgi:hypothetical protein
VGLNEDNLKAEIKDKLASIQSQLPEQQVNELLELFKKHLNLNQGILKLDSQDYADIRDLAQFNYLNMSFPKYIGKDMREVASDEARFLVIIEATIRFLIGKDCFNKIPEFDYKERK